MRCLKDDAGGRRRSSRRPGIRHSYDPAYVTREAAGSQRRHCSSFCRSRALPVDMVMSSFRRHYPCPSRTDQVDTDLPDTAASSVRSQLESVLLVSESI
jgi:hypothetical protein